MWQNKNVLNYSLYMTERHRKTDTTQAHNDRLVMIDKETIGHEVSALQLAELQNIDGEVYLETESGNTYMIYKTPGGKLAMVDSRNNQGKGDAMRGRYLSEDDIKNGVLIVKKPFAYNGGHTSSISRITFINKGEKPLAEEQGPVSTSDVRNRFRESLDPVTGKKIDFEAIGKSFSLDDNNPPKPESILPPMGGNFFENDDNPTLAGIVIAKVYKELIEREVKPSKEKADKILEQCGEELKKFFYYVKDILLQREKEGKKGIGLGNKRVDGTDQFFHSYASADHSMYFSKSHAHWKDRKSQEIRAYVTLTPDQTTKDLHKNFVDLVITLYDANIDFTAKCSSPYGAKKRTDNIVIYIAKADQARASAIIKGFLDKRKLGSGHVKAAVPSPRDGLSWAPEPSEKQHKLWNDVSGSSGRASFNSYVAAMAIPTYLDRLAIAHLRKGDKKAADVYSQEAQRVRAIIRKTA